MIGLGPLGDLNDTGAHIPGNAVSFLVATGSKGAVWTNRTQNAEEEVIRDRKKVFSRSVDFTQQEFSKGAVGCGVDESREIRYDRSCKTRHSLSGIAALTFRKKAPKTIIQYAPSSVVGDTQSWRFAYVEQTSAHCQHRVTQVVTTGKCLRSIRVSVHSTGVVLRSFFSIRAMIELIPPKECESEVSSRIPTTQYSFADIETLFPIQDAAEGVEGSETWS
jgi:hypothetical protein